MDILTGKQVIAEYTDDDKHLTTFECDGFLRIGDTVKILHTKNFEKIIEENKKLNDIISAIEGHACINGDCDHWIPSECYTELVQIPELIKELKNNSISDSAKED